MLLEEPSHYRASVVIPKNPEKIADRRLNSTNKCLTIYDCPFLIIQVPYNIKQLLVTLQLLDFMILSINIYIYLIIRYYLINYILKKHGITIWITS